MPNIIDAVLPAKGTPLPKILEGSQIATDLLRDESRMEGNASCAAFPLTTDEVSSLLRWASTRNMSVTVSGGRTGITGGAVPDGGLLISLSKMQRIGSVEKDADGRPYISCGAGVLLSELQNLLTVRKCGLFFPPDPTETSASIGGMIACNASGAHTYRYGPTRDYVRSIKAVLPDGRIFSVKRGEIFAEADGAFILRRSGRREIRGHVPLYPRPSTKNAAGYYSGAGMDLIDLFIGSEGTLGVITEAELYLAPTPETQFGAMLFTDSEHSAIELTIKLRLLKGVEITAIEYFDPGSLSLLRARRERMKAASMVPPGVPEDPNAAAVYVDVCSTKAKVPSDTALIRGVSEALATGKVIATFAAFDKDERERLRKFRHALPETVNALVAERKRRFPKLTKLGTDMAVPDEHLHDIMVVYRKTLDANKLNYVIFGHIGNNHLHVNILPKDMNEYALGKILYSDFAKATLAMNGSISAEHGIGKLKRGFLQLMLGENGIEQMRAVKQVFDPSMMLGPGTLL